MGRNQPYRNNNDPWGRPNKPSGPPDLDALLRKYKNRIISSLGKKRGETGGSGSSGGDDGLPLQPGSWMIGAVVIAIVLIWALSGIFIVAPAEQGVVLRFGKYESTVMPGPHWIPRFIDTDYVVDVQRVSNFSYEAEMLTKDENIISVAVSVQYRVDNARDYLFNVVSPNTSLQQATASALRQVVGSTTLEEALTTGRESVRNQVAQQLQEMLNRYKSGLSVTDVTLQTIKPPEAVTEAFNDAIKAREDQQSYINKANAYTNRIMGGVQGQVSRIIQEAEAYKQEVVLEAQASTAGYLALLPEYQKAPEVTGERMYLSTIESVLSKTNKLIVDEKAGNNLVYLPIDKLLEQSGKKASDMNTDSKAPVAASGTSTVPSDSSYLEQTDNLLNRPSYPLTRGSY